MADLDNLAQQILADLLENFRNRGLNSQDLANGYIGLSLLNIIGKYCGGGAASQVDFDLALKELETGKLADTGPMVPYENDPNSGVIFLMFFSKREYIFLTEKGYRAAQKVKPNPRPASRTTVNISGGTFHHSPIGVGEQVTQSVNVNVDNQTEITEYLLQLLTRTGTSPDDATKHEVMQLVEATTKGDLPTAKPLFQRLFGEAAESIRQVAWGVVSAIIAKQLGI